MATLQIITSRGRKTATEYDVVKYSLYNLHDRMTFY